MTEEQIDATKMKISRKTLLYIILIVLTLVSILPWFKEGIAATDDFRHHITKFWWIKYSFENYGGFTEWMPLIYSGWPLTHFYHSLPYFLSLPFILWLPAIASLKASIVISFILSAVAMLFAVRKITKNTEIAAIAAIFYILAPLHFEFAYMSGSISRLWAYIFLPLTIAYFISMLEEGGKKNAILTAVFSAALIYTHIQIAIALSYFLAAYLIYHFFIKEKKIQISKIKNLILCAILILGLLSFWLIPYFNEKEDSTAAGMNKVFNGAPGELTLNQVFSRWFGRSENSRSFYLGYVFLAVSLLGILTVKFVDKKIFAVLGIGGVLFSVYTKPLGILPFASTIYSNYLLMIGIFFLSIIAATFVHKISLQKNGVLILLGILALFIIDVYPAQTTYYWTNQNTEAYTNSPQILQAYSFIRQQPGLFRTYSPVGEMSFMYTSKGEIGTEWTGFREGAFKPIRDLTDDLFKVFTANITNPAVYSTLGYMGTKYIILPCIDGMEKLLPVAFTNKVVCVYENPLFTPLIVSPKTVETTLKPGIHKAEAYVFEECFANCMKQGKNIGITDVIFEPEKISFMANSEGGYVLVKSAYFKEHWNAYMDGKKIEIKKAWPYYMLIEVPEGVHDVNFKYENNINHIIGAIVSILTLALIGWLVFKRSK